MSTPRELLGIRDDLAKKVAEHQIDRSDAVTDLRAAVAKYPELLDKLADDWADAEIDRGVKRYVARRNKAQDAEIARKLAEIGMERPALDGNVRPISEDDESYGKTLGAYRDYVSTYRDSSRRLVKSFERREEDNEVLVEAAGGNLGVTREKAVDLLKRMPEAQRTVLRARVHAKLQAERIAYLSENYEDYGRAAEG